MDVVQMGVVQMGVVQMEVVLLGLVKMVVDRPGVDQLFIAGYANLVPIVLLG